MPEFYCVKFGLMSAIFFLGVIVFILVACVEIMANSPKKQILNKGESRQ